MYQVITDQEFSRRKRFHHIADGDGKVVFSSHLIGSVFDWLYDAGHHQFILETEDAIYRLDISIWKA